MGLRLLLWFTSGIGFETRRVVYAPHKKAAQKAAFLCMQLRLDAAVRLDFIELVCFFPGELGTAKVSVRRR
jgi:hypothetical protein